MSISTLFKKNQEGLQRVHVFDSVPRYANSGPRRVTPTVCARYCTCTLASLRYMYSRLPSMFYSYMLRVAVRRRTRRVRSTRRCAAASAPARRRSRPRRSSRTCCSSGAHATTRKRRSRTCGPTTAPLYAPPTCCFHESYTVRLSKCLHKTDSHSVKSYSVRIQRSRAIIIFEICSR